MPTLKTGFAKQDITPRIGVELCGFGPFLNRHSNGIRDRLWARVMALQTEGGQIHLLITCDLVGITLKTTAHVRSLLYERCGIDPDHVMICCSHTHSGPSSGCYIGWGDPDPPWLAVLPHRIAAAAQKALDQMQPATLHHAETPCEGIGLNREYDKDAPPLEEVLKEDWRPAKPELTDTTCHVLSARDTQGKLLGFVSYFGCHPVVCCQQTYKIHGDFPGIATNVIEREHDHVVGLFLQGAQGDINSCVVHKPEKESLLALDIIAARFAKAIRQGIKDATLLDIDDIENVRREVTFTRKPWTLDEIKTRLQACEHAIAEIASEPAEHEPADASHEVRLNMVHAIALRALLQRAEEGTLADPSTELHAMRIGPITLLGSPFETFRAIARDVVEQSCSRIPLVVSFVNDSVGYATDETCTKRGGYAADAVPLICGERPYANIHHELVRELLATDKQLRHP